MLRRRALSRQGAFMPESEEQYKARFAAYVEGKDVIAMQREAPHTLARLMADIHNHRLKTRPAPGKWSVTEIVAHMAEDELISTCRYRQMLEHKSPNSNNFAQDRCA